VRLTVDGETFEASPEKLTNVEGMAVEKVTGLTFTEWTESLERGSMLGLTALVLVMRKRTNPELRFGDVEFELASLSVDEEEGPKDAEPSTETAPST
jgi:hypothetical protein